MADDRDGIPVRLTRLQLRVLWDLADDELERALHTGPVDLAKIDSLRATCRVLVQSLYLPTGEQEPRTAWTGMSPDQVHVGQTYRSVHTGKTYIVREITSPTSPFATPAVSYSHVGSRQLSPPLTIELFCQLFRPN